MIQPQENLNRAQRSAKEYMEKYLINEIISGMLNTLVHSRDEKPIIFMVKFVHR